VDNTGNILTPQSKILKSNILNSLLITKSILCTAIRAFPGDTVAGHSPLVFIHAILANSKSAAAGPAERECLAAAVALFCASSFFSFFSFFSIGLHITNPLLL
jgi:hypothetical protein